MCLQPVTKQQRYLQAIKAIIFLSNELLQNLWIRDISLIVFASSFTAVFCNIIEIIGNHIPPAVKSGYTQYTY